jgi:transcription elongation GreA/GreB family factor
MQKELVILDDDKIYARRRVEELEKEIQDLGPEFYEVFNQSSETWHDNAPFDALRDRQSVLAAELQNLRIVLRSSAISVPKLKKNTVGIGNVVTLENGKRYFIAGDWTPHAGQEKDGMLVVSAGTPLARAMIGKKPGDEITAGKITSKIVALGTAG